MGFGGLTIDKIFVILLIALFIIGPEKLPGYAQKLGELVRSVKRMADGAKDRLKEEMGPEFDEVDWKQLDPRQYDPRRIIRDALLEDEREAHTQARKARAIEASEARRARLAERKLDTAAPGTETALAGSDTVLPGADTAALGTSTAVRNFDDEAT